MNIRLYTSPNSFRSPSENLTRLYIAALTTVAVLIILGQILVQRSINDQLSDSRVVNLAGKQRFKSQEISKLVLLIQYHYDHPDYLDKARSLDSLLITWEKEHLGLKGGSEELDLPGTNSGKVAAMFKEADIYFYSIFQNARIISDYTKNGDSLAPLQIQFAVKEVMNNEKIFLTKMDNIVQQYDTEAKAKVLFLRKIETILLLLTLIILALEAYFIFRPAVNKIKTTIDELICSEQKASALANDLYQANVHLRESNNREQKIRVSSLIEGQENERKTISMEIHDGLGQLLNALNYNLQSIEIEKLEEKNKLKFVKNLTSDAIQETRRISYNLMPTVLSDMGLIPALKHLVQYTSKVSGMTIVFENETATKRLPGNKEIHLYRISQESVNNAVKYSKAKKITIKLQEQQDRYILSIQDDGIGFDSSQPSKEGDRFKSGNGLLNIKERANIIDGTVSILSSNEKGTLVKIELQKT